jgi:hypothetical protein
MKKIFYQSIYKIILIKIFFFLILNSSAYSFYKKNFEVILPEEIFIKLEKKELGQYGNYIYEIINDKSSNIHPKFKKYLNGKISFKIKDYYIQNDIDLRIIGDWKDHIDSENLITSLQISIKNKNIGGVKKFRLYLPNTRLGENEILWSTIHEVFGFPTLHRQFIKVNFNNNNYVALFEEATEKEFLERWSFRESPIIEYDERQIWLDRYNLLNEELVDKESDRYKIDNASFIKNDLDTIITQKALKIRNNFIIEGFDELNKDIGKHGLIKHNRKFIYDPIYNLHLPLYFDGNINLDQIVDNSEKCQNIIEKKWEQKKENLSSKLNLIIDMFEDRSKKKANDRIVCIVKNILIEKDFNLKDIMSDEINKSVRNLNNFQYQNKIIKNRKDQSFYYGYNIEEKKFCKSKNSLFEACDQLEYDDVRNLLVGRLSVSKISIPFNIGFYNNEKNKKIFNQFKNLIIQEDTEISVDNNTNLYLKIFNESKDKIDLKINLTNDRTSKLIIFDSNLDNLNISLNSLNRSAEKFDNKIRYNQNLLTGCLTIIDSKFNDVSISSNGTGCEDDINIFRSVGNIKNISIKNSDYDSIDFDYSNLKIKNVQIKNAGNDCMDFSFGNILIEKIIVENCKDKGISVGEKTKFIAFMVDVSSSEIGVANKDGSVSFIKEIKVNNVKKCLENYQKKQEFELGFLNFVKSNCKKQKIINLQKISLEQFKEMIQNNA